MELDQVRHVLAVVKYRTFLEASFQLNRSQSSLSKSIRRLEEELGISIFERTTRRVELTPAGRDFVAYAEQMMVCYEGMLHAMEQHRSNGKRSLRVGSIYFGLHNRLAPLVANFSKLHPSMEIEIRESTTTPLLQREQYRNGVWGASNELTGAVSQIQVNCAQWETDARTERNREQLPRIYTVSPKGIVVIGKTSELNNWDKRNSFERFRQELRCPEVLTYDELYERAKFIAEGPAPLDEDTDFDMPF